MLMSTVKSELKALAIYIVILIAALELVDTKVGAIKTDINTYARVTCLAGGEQMILGKYDDLVQTQIDANSTAQALALRQGRSAAAALNSANIARLNADLITVTKPDCSKPILP